MNKFTNTFLYLLMALLLALNLTAANAEDEEEEEAAAPETVYVDLDKAFIVTLADQGKMRYLKTEIQAVVEGDDMAEKIRFHSAPIRNELILLLSGKTKGELKSVDAREDLTMEALKVINARLGELDKSLIINDLLYTTFVVQ